MGTIKKVKNRKGDLVFDATVRRKGLPPSCKRFKRLTDARRWIQDVESDIRAGRYQPKSEAARHTLAEAIDRFIEEEIPRRQRVNSLDQKRQLLWLKGLWGYKLLCEVSPSLLIETRKMFFQGVNKHGKARKPQSWNRCLSTLSVMFQSCLNEWEWMEYNPARRIRREKEAPGRVRFLSDDERTRLLDVCKNNRSPNLYPLVVLALSTGMRRGEVVNSRWSQVDLNVGVIILEKTKNGERRRVPVRSLALTLLKAHNKVRRIDTDLVFPGDTTGRTGRPFELPLYWNEALTAAKITDFHFHDLRHSCASYLAMEGVSPDRDCGGTGPQDATDGEAVFTSLGESYGECRGEDESENLWRIRQ